MNDEPRRRAARQEWENAAATFDDAPDHGLRDPRMRTAWTELLRQWLPAAAAAVLDIGCGTGSLSLVLAELGHRVTGIDFAPAMIAQAGAKAAAAGQRIRFEVMDAAAPSLAPHTFDVIVCRHLLWTLTDRTEVLRHWAELLTPGGRLLLIEGRWHTGAGLDAAEIVAALPASFTQVAVRRLSDESDLWGGAVSDDRYAVIADLAATSPA